MAADSLLFVYLGRNETKLMCELFQSRFCESCVIHYSTYHFTVKPKHLWWSQICFSGGHSCCLIAFVAPVQMSHVISWVWGFIWWWSAAEPQQRRSSEIVSVSRGAKYWKRQLFCVSACEEQLLLHELGATLRDLFVWLPGPSRLKVFPPVGFLHTWCFGTHEILKKLFVISR